MTKIICHLKLRLHQRGEIDLASLIGSYSLGFGLFFSTFIIFFSVKNLRDTEILDKRIIFFTFTQFFFVVVSFFGLILSFINSDFSNETVFNHSHTTKPLFYKISGTWGNHEGSFCLLYTSPSPRDVLRSRMPSSA